MVRNTLAEGTLTVHLKEAIFEPKMTRSRFKEAVEKGKIPPTWGFTPTKLNSIPSKSFLDLYFSEDDEDEEYNPTLDELQQISDEDEGTMSSSQASEFGSPALRSNPHTPHSCSTSIQSCSDNLDTNFTSISKGKPSTPMGPPTSCPRIRKLQPSDDKNLNVALRTRSKLPLTDTSIEDLESSFAPPDFNPSFYTTYSDDEDWQKFLATLNKEDTSFVEDESIDDPEFNVLAELEQEDVDDLEERRNDRSVQISKKEIKELMEELFECLNNNEDFENNNNFNSFEEFGDKDDDNNDNNNDDNDNINKNDNDNTSVLNFSKISQPFQYPGHIPPLNMDKALTSSLVTNLAMHDDSTNDANDVKSDDKQMNSSDDIILVNENEMVQIKYQMRKHVQLLAQSYIQCFPIEYPEIEHFANTVKHMLTELRVLGQRSFVRYELSCFRAVNLEAAIELTHKDFNEKDSRFQNLLMAEFSGLYMSSRNYQICGLMYSQMDAMANSKVFIFPKMLPILRFIPDDAYERKVRNFFIESEDILLAMGLDEFGHLPNKYELIHRLLIPTKSVKQLSLRVKNLRLKKAKGGKAIQFLKDNGRLPDVERCFELEDEKSIVPPIQRPINQQPTWIQVYIKIRDKISMQNFLPFQLSSVNVIESTINTPKKLSRRPTMSHSSAKICNLIKSEKSPEKKQNIYYISIFNGTKNESLNENSLTIGYQSNGIKMGVCTSCEIMANSKCNTESSTQADADKNNVKIADDYLPMPSLEGFDTHTNTPTPCYNLQPIILSLDTTHNCNSNDMSSRLRIAKNRKIFPKPVEYTTVNDRADMNDNEFINLQNCVSVTNGKNLPNNNNLDASEYKLDNCNEVKQVDNNLNSSPSVNKIGALDNPSTPLKFSCRNSFSVDTIGRGEEDGVVVSANTESQGLFLTMEQLIKLGINVTPIENQEQITYVLTPSTKISSNKENVQNLTQFSRFSDLNFDDASLFGSNLISRAFAEAMQSVQSPFVEITIDPFIQNETAQMNDSFESQIGKKSFKNLLNECEGGGGESKNVMTFETQQVSTEKNMVDNSLQPTTPIIVMNGSSLKDSPNQAYLISTNFINVNNCDTKIVADISKDKNVAKKALSFETLYQSEPLSIDNKIMQISHIHSNVDLREEDSKISSNNTSEILVQKSKDNNLTSENNKLFQNISDDISVTSNLNSELLVKSLDLPSFLSTPIKLNPRSTLPVQSISVLVTPQKYSVEIERLPAIKSSPVFRIVTPAKEASQTIMHLAAMLTPPDAVAIKHLDNSHFKRSVVKFDNNFGKCDSTKLIVSPYKRISASGDQMHTSTDSFKSTKNEMIDNNYSSHSTPKCPISSPKLENYNSNCETIDNNIILEDKHNENIINAEDIICYDIEDYNKSIHKIEKADSIDNLQIDDKINISATTTSSSSLETSTMNNKISNTFANPCCNLNNTHHTLNSSEKDINDCSNYSSTENNDLDADDLSINCHYNPDDAATDAINQNSNNLKNSYIMIINNQNNYTKDSNLPIFLKRNRIVKNVLKQKRRKFLFVDGSSDDEFRKKIRNKKFEMQKVDGKNYEFAKKLSLSKSDKKMNTAGKFSTHLSSKPETLSNPRNVKFDVDDEDDEGNDDDGDDLLFMAKLFSATTNNEVDRKLANMAKKNQKKELTLALLNKSIINDDTRRREKDERYARWFMQCCKQDLNPIQYSSFLHSLVLYSQYTNSKNFNELFDDLKSILKDNDHLFKSFIHFLTSKQAAEVDQMDAFNQHQKSQHFLTMIQKLFERQPNALQKIFKVIRSHAEGRITESVFVKSMRHQLRGHSFLINEFNSFLPHAKPVLRKDNFEEIVFSGDKTNDDFEQVNLNGSINNCESFICPCNKETKSDDREICNACRMKVIKGQLLLRTGPKFYKPAQIIYTSLNKKFTFDMRQDPLANLSPISSAKRHRRIKDHHRNHHHHKQRSKSSDKIIGILSSRAGTTSTNNKGSDVVVGSASKTGADLKPAKKRRVHFEEGLKSLKNTIQFGGKRGVSWFNGGTADSNSRKIDPSLILEKKIRKRLSYFDEGDSPRRPIKNKKRKLDYDDGLVKDATCSADDCPTDDLIGLGAKNGEANRRLIKGEGGVKRVSNCKNRDDTKGRNILKNRSPIKHHRTRYGEKYLNLKNDDAASFLNVRCLTDAQLKPHVDDKFNECKGVIIQQRPIDANYNNGGCLVSSSSKGDDIQHKAINYNDPRTNDDKINKDIVSVEPDKIDNAFLKSLDLVSLDSCLRQKAGCRSKFVKHVSMDDRIIIKKRRATPENKDLSVNISITDYADSEIDVISRSKERSRLEAANQSDKAMNATNADIVGIGDSKCNTRNSVSDVELNLDNDDRGGFVDGAARFQDRSEASPVNRGDATLSLASKFGQRDGNGDTNLVSNGRITSMGDLQRDDECLNLTKTHAGVNRGIICPSESVDRSRDSNLETDMNHVQSRGLNTETDANLSQLHGSNLETNINPWTKEEDQAILEIFLVNGVNEISINQIQAEVTNRMEEQIIGRYVELLQLYAELMPNTD